jgi:hypothetical protein
MGRLIPAGTGFVAYRKLGMVTRNEDLEDASASQSAI